MRDYTFEILSIEKSAKKSFVDTFTWQETVVYEVEAKCIQDDDIITVFIFFDDMNDKEYIKSELLAEKARRDTNCIFLSCGDIL